MLERQSGKKVTKAGRFGGVFERSARNVDGRYDCRRAAGAFE